MRASSAARVTDIRDRRSTDPRWGFESHSEFLEAVIANADARTPAQVRDDRLPALMTEPSAEPTAFFLPRAFTPRSILATAGSDEQAGYATRYGGAVGTQLISDMSLTRWEGDPTAQRCLRIPMEQSIVQIVARTDSDHTTSVTGGLTVTRTPEAVAPGTSRASMEQIVLEASSLIGLAYGTQELVDASPAAFAAIVADGFKLEYGATMLKEKIRGLGGDQYLGVLNSPAKISVSKETNQAAATIVGENIFRMAARSWGINGAIWLANHDTREQLYKLSNPIGTGGAPIYVPPETEGAPAMLLEAPLFYTEHASTCGTEGDLILCNWSQYLDGLYQMRTDESVHVRFVQHEMALRFWVRNAGAPWWRAQLTPQNSTTTLSPIVTLATRS